MAAAAPTTGITLPAPLTGALTISPTWAELFASPQQVFPDPRVDYAILSALINTSTDGPDTLLMRVEALAHRSPVILALISDKEPNQITLLKNPCRFSGSLVNPSLVVDNLVYGFTGTDMRNLAAVHLPSSAFENSAQYNVLDDPAAIRAGLDGLPVDQSFHPYVLATTPGMTNSVCQRTMVLPPNWYQQLATHFPHGIDLTTFYDQFLATVPVGERQALETVFSWWRHTASRTAGTVAPWSGLQVITQQAMSPTT